MSHLAKILGLNFTINELKQWFLFSPERHCWTGRWLLDLKTNERARWGQQSSFRGGFGVIEAGGHLGSWWQTVVTWGDEVFVENAHISFDDDGLETSGQDSSELKTKAQKQKKRSLHFPFLQKLQVESRVKFWHFLLLRQFSSSFNVLMV